jgi:hypothetical protein
MASRYGGFARDQATKTAERYPMSARNNQIQLQEKQFESRDEIDIAIAKFQRRVEDVQGLDPATTRHDSQAKKCVEEAIATTIREVFGLKSPEAHRHPCYQIWHGGHNTGDDEWNYQENFAAGIPDAVAFLEGFIKLLKEKKDFFEPPKKVTGEQGARPAYGGVQQRFYAPVGAVAGGDIANVSITAPNVLSIIEQAIEKSDNIPASEKPSLLERVRAIKDNPYVIKIASGVVTELLKKLMFSQ